MPFLGLFLAYFSYADNRPYVNLYCGIASDESILPIPRIRTGFSHFVEISRNLPPHSLGCAVGQVLPRIRKAEQRSDRDKPLTCGFVLMMHLMNH